MSSERIVIVGFGPVAASLAQALAPSAATGDIDLTVVGAENYLPYNRVLLAELAVGAIPAEQLCMVSGQQLASSGVKFLLGKRATGIDRARRVLHLQDAADLPFDRLVLATGSRPLIPALGGVNFAPHTDVSLPGRVHALRTLDDAVNLRNVLSSGGRVLILGGGVIGVEAALAMAAAGHRPILLHHGPAPLGKMVDTDAGRLLVRELAEAGVEVMSATVAQAIEKDDNGFTGLVTSTGVIRADALLIATGVHPRTELAAGAGLPVGRGIKTNRYLAVDRQRHIFAVGDCAEVDGTGPAGLLAPGWAQATWLARHLLGEASEPPRFDAPRLVMLKGQSIDLVAAGTVSQDLWSTDGTNSTVYADPAQGRYLKATLTGRTLSGFVCLGLPSTAAELALAFEQGREMPADLSTLLRLDDPAGCLGGIAGGPDDQLCRCSGATYAQVRDAVSKGSHTVTEVGERCRAGTGCGGCRDKITQLLDEHAMVS